jgi:hypothetical protein
MWGETRDDLEVEQHHNNKAGDEDVRGNMKLVKDSPK